MIKVITSVLVCAFMAGHTFAATSSVVVDPGNIVPGTVANALMADGEGLDWMGGTLDIQLAAGLFYEHPQGSLTAPNTLFFGIIPELAFDTYFGILDDTSTNYGCTADWPNNCWPYYVDPTHLAGGWLNLRTTDTGPVKVGNVTLSDDAQGSWQIASLFEGWVVIQNGGPIVDGVMLPEPGTVVLLGIGAAVMFTRR